MDCPCLTGDCLIAKKKAQKKAARTHACDLSTACLAQTLLRGLAFSVDSPSVTARPFRAVRDSVLDIRAASRHRSGEDIPVIVAQDRGRKAMKLTIERGDLLNALSHVQNVVERRNTIPDPVERA